MQKWLEGLADPAPAIVFLGHAVGLAAAKALEREVIARLLQQGAELINMHDRPDTAAICSAMQKRIRRENPLINYPLWRQREILAAAEREVQ